MDVAGECVMKVYLIEKGDVQVFGRDGAMKILCDGSGEYVETRGQTGEQTKLRLVREHELSRRWWVWYALFFWVIGFFGFLTPRYSKFTGKLDGALRFTEKEGGVIKVRFAKVYADKGGGTSALTVFSEEDVAVENGFYISDKSASRRRTLYGIFSWLARVAFAALLIAVIIK